MHIEETGLPSFPRGGAIKALSTLITIFLKDGTQVLRKTFLGSKTGKRLRECLHLNGTEIYNRNFSKVNALRKKSALGPGGGGGGSLSDV